ncbi:hypothetical protein ASPZODRAFT_132175 [Penicilliopsis zonata CBS 506.65]|uniref:Uncharacterized protein n=1 Tax=Penicilliopsis zonata CBS 506.65 TaxID=1073090 RepID=A0A1L9SJJ2_9EURO|nr:hypothetical protein ASPZODRAFT_132175 [Penicilliopsis zonata CBS 506.65]OJJ47214.1 hypothetical protein ASPZODRAFT_132175 [Penicilliopsis zonata CBS 506.65]
MVSDAAMLLDPRNYKRQFRANDPRTQDSSDSPQAGAANVATPAGTLSIAHRLLNPRRDGTPSANRMKPSPRAETASSRIDRSGQQNKMEAGSGIEFRFASPQEESGNDAKRSSEYLNAFNESQHGSFIEDMYNVERRGNHMRKRLKMDHNQNSTKKSSFHPHENNGLGKWMKSEQGVSDTSSPATPDIVDLTIETPSHSSNDDDLQVTGANNLSHQRVCYGKLENAMIQAHFVPKPSAKSIFSDSKHDWPSMKLAVHRQSGPGNRIAVSDPNTKVFGAIDAKTATAIAPLLDFPALKVDLTARLDVRKRLPGEEPWGHCSALYRASINLYGLRKDAELIGKHLGQHNVWLGTPNSVEPGVPVFNPHAEKRRAQANFAPVGGPRGRLGINYEIRTAEEVNDAVMKMFDQLRTADNLPEMEPPASVQTPLLRHQKQALWFMSEKEKPRRFGPKEEDNNSLWRIHYRANGRKQYREVISGTVVDEEPPQTLGGLLADMMGLGKTLSILSLVVSSIQQSREWENMVPHQDLVHSQPGIRNTRTTLLVVPLSTVNNWVAQIKEHLREDSLSYNVFHGSSRTTDVEELSRFDLVITTYSIVLSELSGRGTKRGVSPLTKMNMFRIVLDEAHTIREQSAAQTQAIFKLNAQRRWSVTGTPIQNRLEDLLSVTKFLSLFPYDDRSRFGAHILSRFKTGDPSVLASLRVLVDSFTLRRVKDTIDLPPRHDQIISLTFTDEEQQLHEFFRKESNMMMNVIAGESKSKIGGRMYHHVLKAMMILRQVSAHGKELLDRDDRERIKGLSVQDAIDLEEGNNDPTAAATDRKAYEMFTLMQNSAGDSCALCGKRLEEPDTGNDAADRKAVMAIMLPCFDVLCLDCFSGWQQAFDTQAGSEVKCQACEGWIPMAYSTITPAGLKKYLVEQAEAKQTRKQGKTLGDYEGPHTKTRALIDHLLQAAEQTKILKENSEPPIKSVVFSAWTSHLDLIEIALRDNGITGYTRLDGTMSLAARNNALQIFRDDDSVVVLLATIGAGGVGLNLTSASQVYVMEPQYNPAAVAQAVDRVHRLGQTREVSIVQFIMKSSIEEKIFELAKKKQQLADMSMNRGKLDRKEVQEQRMREYRSLFK